MKRTLRISLLTVAAIVVAAACGTTTPGHDPRVLSTDPANGQLNVPPVSSIAVTFDHAMAASSITTNTTDTVCSGTLQLSDDDFATCVRMAAAPASSGGGATFSAAPAAPMVNGTTYRLKVKAGVSSSEGRILRSDFVMANGFTVGTGGVPTPTPTPGPWRHTITIDGNDDFSATDEKFPTTSANYFGYVTWDASNLYVAVQGADVKSGDANKFFVAYFGGIGGTTTGVTFNTQQPTLPFPAKYEVQWGANNNNSTFAFVWSGSAWVSTSWNFAGHVFANTGTGYLEMSIPLSRLGSPTHVPLVMSMLNQTGGVEATYSGVPHDAWPTDTFDPNFAHWFDFDFAAQTPPNATLEN